MSVLFLYEDIKFKDPIKYANSHCRNLKGCKRHLLIYFLLFTTFLSASVIALNDNYENLNNVSSGYCSSYFWYQNC